MMDLCNKALSRSTVVSWTDIQKQVAPPTQQQARSLQAMAAAQAASAAPLITTKNKQLIKQCTDYLIKHIKNLTQSQVVDQLENFAQTLGLAVQKKDDETSSLATLFLSSAEDFYFEVVIDQRGDILDAKFSLFNEPSKSLSVLKDMFSSWNLDLIASSVKDIKTSFVLTHPDQQIRAKSFKALCCLEQDLATLYQVQLKYIERQLLQQTSRRVRDDSPLFIDKLVNCAPIGLFKRSDLGRSMHVYFYVSPQDLLLRQQQSATKKKVKLEHIVQTGLGLYGHISLQCTASSSSGEESRLHVLPDTCLGTLSLAESDDAITHETLSPYFNNCNYAFAPHNVQGKALKGSPPLLFGHGRRQSATNEVPATFVLTLNKPVVFCSSTLTQLQAQLNGSGPALIPDTNTKKERQPSFFELLANVNDKLSNDTYSVHLPDETHIYYMNPEAPLDLTSAVKVDKLAFTHPHHLVMILSALRKQSLFNELVLSCMRKPCLNASYCLSAAAAATSANNNNNSESNANATTTRMLELSLVTAFCVSVTMQHPQLLTYTTIEIDVTGASPSLFRAANNGSLARIQTRFCDHHDLHDPELISEVARRCHSIPVTVRALLMRFRNATASSAIPPTVKYMRDADDDDFDHEGGGDGDYSYNNGGGGAEEDDVEFNDAESGDRDDVFTDGGRGGSPHQRMMKAKVDLATSNSKKRKASLIAQQQQHQILLLERQQDEQDEEEETSSSAAKRKLLNNSGGNSQQLKLGVSNNNNKDKRLSPGAKPGTMPHKNVTKQQQQQQVQMKIKPLTEDGLKIKISKEIKQSNIYNNLSKSFNNLSATEVPVKQPPHVASLLLNSSSASLNSNRTPSPLTLSELPSELNDESSSLPKYEPSSSSSSSVNKSHLNKSAVPKQKPSSTPLQQQKSSSGNSNKPMTPPLSSSQKASLQPAGFAALAGIGLVLTGKTSNFKIPKATKSSTTDGESANNSTSVGGGGGGGASSLSNENEDLLLTSNTPLSSSSPISSSSIGNSSSTSSPHKPYHNRPPHPLAKQATSAANSKFSSFKGGNTAASSTPSSKWQSATSSGGGSGSSPRYEHQQAKTVPNQAKNSIPAQQKNTSATTTPPPSSSSSSSSRPPPTTATGRPVTPTNSASNSTFYNNASNNRKQQPSPLPQPRPLLPSASTASQQQKLIPALMATALQPPALASALPPQAPPPPPSKEISMTPSSPQSSECIVSTSAMTTVVFDDTSPNKSHHNKPPPAILSPPPIPPPPDSPVCESAPIVVPKVIPLERDSNEPPVAASSNKKAAAASPASIASPDDPNDDSYEEEYEEARQEQHQHEEERAVVAEVQRQQQHAVASPHSSSPSIMEEDLEEDEDDDDYASTADEQQPQQKQEESIEGKSLIIS